jgi:hypothetical protein
MSETVSFAGIDCEGGRRGTVCQPFSLLYFRERKISRIRVKPPKKRVHIEVTRKMGRKTEAGLLEDSMRSSSVIGWKFGIYRGEKSRKRAIEVQSGISSIQRKPSSKLRRKRPYIRITQRNRNSVKAE